MPTQPNTVLDTWCPADSTHCYQDGIATVPCTADGDPVVVWTDYAITFGAVSNSLHPGLYRPTGILGKPAVQGNGTDIGLNGTFLDGAVAFTFWCVFKPGASIAVNERIVDKEGAFFVYNTGTNAWAANVQGTPIAPPNAVSDTAPHMLILKRDGSGNATIKVDGEVNKTTGVSVGTTALNSSVFSLLYFYNSGSPSAFSSSYIGDFGIKASATSDADDAVLFAYGNSYYSGLGGLFRRGRSVRPGCRGSVRPTCSL